MIYLTHPEICIKVGNFAQFPNPSLEVVFKQMSVFMCFFLAIWPSSFGKAVFNSLAHFFIGLLIWGEFSFSASYIFWLLIPCQLHSCQ
jgi:hypothetical protein